MRKKMNNKVFVIAEIGINHNGDTDTARQLIDLAVDAGCDAVKFQKRTIEDVYTKNDLDRYRESPWGTTNRQQKLGLEFQKEQYDQINDYCKEKNIEWFASCWDIQSQKFMRQYNLKYNKVASPMLTVLPLLEEIASEGKYTFISTGMSNMEEIEAAVSIFNKHKCPFELMHCVSAYPMPNEQANLKIISVLKEKFNCSVGYSGHEAGLQISLIACALGATSIERHITLDRAMYGSDQAASLAPDGIKRLVRDIRIYENSLGSGLKRVQEFEVGVREKLSKPKWYVEN
jgi:N-acetylneuraminate synthase